MKISIKGKQICTAAWNINALRSSKYARACVYTHTHTHETLFHLHVLQKEAVFFSEEKERGAISESRPLSVKMGDVEIPALVKQIVRDYTDLMLFNFFFVCLPPKSLLWRLAIVLDVIMFGILAAMDSAAMAAAYLHKNGDSQALWPPICSQVPTYCYRVILAISIGLGGVFMFLLIIIFSISAILNPLILV
ncbi:hypothetical protein OIU76_028225 [Salix suchowensis]|nr:hypothetical protein OIU76_028225 [Salix suchowensis]